MPKQDAKLLQGTLDMLILKALSLEPLHGFGVGQRIMQMSADALRVEEGSLYPALQRMLMKGWLVAQWDRTADNRRARYYQLTRAGRTQLDEERGRYRRVSAAIARILEPA